MGGATSRLARVVVVLFLGGLLAQAACSGETTSSTPSGCPAGQASCEGACVDTALDPANCGACGNTCADGELCSGGQCGIGCFGGTTECGGACVDTSFDPSHCGGCGVICAEGEVCSAGSCGLDCAGGTTNCGGLCVDTKLDGSHCGGCDNVCAPDEVCSAGQCGFECTSGETLCGSQCVDTESDPAHCGACGGACAEGEVCQLGACVLSCGGGTTKCGNKCVDTLVDAQNCGSCGNACGPGQPCAGGVCVPNGIDAYTVLMLHMDGPDGSTTFADSSGKNHVMTAAGGGKMAVATSKFGAASGAFLGTGDYVGTPGGADFDFGSGDFTIDAWVYLTNASARRVIYDGLSSGATGQILAHDPSLGWIFAERPPGGNYTNIVTQGAVTMSLDAWHHVAVARNGTAWSLYLDGAKVGSATSSYALYSTNAYTIRVGSWADAGATATSGYVDELRVSKGVARWTASFSPPAAPYF